MDLIFNGASQIGRDIELGPEGRENKHEEIRSGDRTVKGKEAAEQNSVNLRNRKRSVYLQYIEQGSRSNKLKRGRKSRQRSA